MMKLNLKRITFFNIICVTVLGINSCGNNQQVNEIINDFENLSIIGHIDSSSGNEITVCDRHYDTTELNVSNSISLGVRNLVGFLL